LPPCLSPERDFMSATEIILIRHGETEWNLSGRWQGHADSALSPRGIAQAEALAIRMRSEPVDAVYVSDLERALHTARLVGTSSGWECFPMDELRERDLGVLEGLTTDEMKVEHPNVYEAFRTGGPDYQPPGGESFRQFSDRCSEVIEQLARKHLGQKIAVVTHGGVLGVLFRKVLNLGLEAERNFLLLNCSVNRIQKTSDRWSLISWGDVAHLQNVTSLDDS
jgi:probable phosphoglycerate mutase